MTVTMTYNARCGTARAVLEHLRAKGIEPQIREYLKAPLTRDEIAALAQAAGVRPRDFVRWKETDALAEAGVNEKSSDAALLDAMAAHPILLNRPIVTTPKGTRLCRPSETVAELL